jgi:3-isopropylmalate/(R)-2-methylmalate dehydratase small subunit
MVQDGDRIQVNVRAGTVMNLTTGKGVTSRPPSAFLLEMLESGGLIPLLQTRAAAFLKR